MLRITAPSAGVISDGLMMAVQPAAMAPVSGTKLRNTGTFHGAMISAAPLGS